MIRAILWLMPLSICVWNCGLKIVAAQNTTQSERKDLGKFGDENTSADALNRPPATDSMLTELFRDADAYYNPEEAVALFERFLQSHSTDKSQASRIQLQSEEFQTKADAGMVHVGSKWVLQAEAEQKVREANELVAQASELIKSGGIDDAVKLLTKASNINQNGISADFALGMMYSHVFGRDAKEAASHFRVVLSRAPNHLSALNNLAILEIKLGKHREAYSRWKLAGEVAPNSPELAQNIGRVIRSSGRGLIPMNDSILRNFKKLYEELTTEKGAQAFDVGTGWLYMPLYVSGREREDSLLPGARLVATGFGTGFVVHPNYVLTSADVVVNSDYGQPDIIQIIDPSDANGKSTCEATIVADSQDGLVLLKSDSLKRPPIRLNPDFPKAGSDVLIVGYPETWTSGRSIRPERGVIVRQPGPAHTNLAMFDSAATFGHTGGPVVDDHGTAIAAITVAYKGTSFTAGVAASDAIPFLKQQIPDLNAAPVNTQPRAWPEVEAQVSPSTVMIMTYLREIPLGLDTKKIERQWNYLEDPHCIACNGGGSADCPAGRCFKGVTSVRQSYQTVEGIPPNQKVFTKYRMVKVACGVCNGAGRVDCKHCTNGLDPEVRRH